MKIFIDSADDRMCAITLYMTKRFYNTIKLVQV